MIVVGTNHKYSSLEFREKFSFSKKNLETAYSFFIKECRFDGCVIINTCNRIEIYVSAKNDLYVIEKIETFLSQFFEISLKTISSSFYHLSGNNAFIHLCNVTCGLDSLLLGETQIAGQVKSAYMRFLSVNNVDDHLNMIFKEAFAINKMVRKSVSFSDCKISIGSIAVEFLKKKIGSLHEKKILIIGVGKVSSLLLKYLDKQTKNIIFIANRTYEKASALASTIGAKAVHFDDLDNLLLDAEIVISATSSTHYIINKKRIDKLLKRSGNKFSRKIYFMDLAVPRDIEPDIRFISGLELINLRDLEPVIKLNIEKRQKQAEEAKDLIAKQVVWTKCIKSDPEEVVSL